jgi:hypothetical protein
MTQEDGMTAYLKSLISEELKKEGIELKEREAQQIVNAIIPKIDQLISNRVKEHFVEIADFIKIKFTDKE